MLNNKLKVVNKLFMIFDPSHNIQITILLKQMQNNFYFEEICPVSTCKTEFVQVRQKIGKQTHWRKKEETCKQHLENG